MPIFNILKKKMATNLRNKTTSISSFPTHVIQIKSNYSNNCRGNYVHIRVCFIVMLNLYYLSYIVYIWIYPISYMNLASTKDQYETHKVYAIKMFWRKHFKLVLYPLPRLGSRNSFLIVWEKKISYHPICHGIV